jgi:sterol desaturase/sphingolipid hydroxylase (fatty acid hydroxylase superfamily)
MHIWHHVHPDAGPANRNFAISIAVWDWLFHTAYVPAQPPARLGMPGGRWRHGGRASPSAGA